ncbi:putative dehydrogenase [Streptomyces himastatinicus ATCC 53653]|uniref:Putative dehydrogenase n=1 Tax=Streptomyces himastatinicus ATCC 53653 TaxID=457427 RepID=D9WMG4_9ACTN|nr:putative dehydrogenase [Streptomyces himastatinicus ATCC 53653]
MEDAVLEPLRAYIRGHATGDPSHFRDAFLPTAHIEGVRDGAFVSWPLAEYCALFHGRSAPDEETRSRRIDAIDVHGTVATATMTLVHGADTFTDIFLLIRVDDSWRIANKTYHRHGSALQPGPQQTSHRTARGEQDEADANAAYGGDGEVRGVVDRGEELPQQAREG